jgi:hypothetical protein
MAITVPNVTLTATLTDQSGTALVNSAIAITLCGSGQVLPRVAGSNLIAKTGPVYYPAPAGQEVAIKLYSNDQIIPAQTYYSIAVFDDKRNILQSGIYEFIGQQTIDLSSAPQLASQPTIAFQGFFSIGLKGTIDGVNRTFSFPFPIDPAQLLLIFYGGDFQRPNIDFVVQASQITFSFAPQPGDTLWAVGASEGLRVPFGLPAISEAPAGLIDGINNVFMLSAKPSIIPMLLVFEGGLFQRPGIDYDASGQQITMNYVPSIGDTLWAVYPS